MRALLHLFVLLAASAAAACSAPNGRATDAPTQAPVEIDAQAPRAIDADAQPLIRYYLIADT